MNAIRTLSRNDPARTRNVGYLFTLAPVLALLFPLAQWLAVPLFGAPWWINVEKLLFLSTTFYAGIAVFTLLAARGKVALQTAVLCNGMALLILLAAMRRFQPPFTDGLAASRPVALAMLLTALIMVAAGVIARLRSGLRTPTSAPASPAT